MDAEDELWNSVLDRIALVEREKMDLHDKISGKSKRSSKARRWLIWNLPLAKAEDPSLQPLLSAKADPFDDSDAGLEEGTIFSVLSP